MKGAVVLVGTMTIMLLIVVYLAGNLVRSIQDERRPNMKIWKNFGLSLGFCLLFFVSWVGQAAAEWQVFTDVQKSHREPVEAGDFAAQFAQSTLENWQSEFLQLFSFTVMAAILIHKGSAESKDSGEDMQRALARIEEKLGTQK